MVYHTQQELETDEEEEDEEYGTAAESGEEEGDSRANEDEVHRLLEVPALAVEKELSRLEEQSAVWVPDSELAYRLCSCPSSTSSTLTITYSDDSGSVHKKSVERSMVQPSSLSHLCADMCNLTELNEASVLHTIRSRYSLRLIHTYSGLFCVVVNPWQRVPLYSQTIMDYYQQQGKVDNSLPPHIYSVAQQAYDGLAQHNVAGTNHTTINQSILITGESGAGKTENTKKIIEYLISAAATATHRKDSSPAGLDAAILSAGVALEAFSNAKTVHNNNSSRLGKFIRIDFGCGFSHAKAMLNSARIDCYLLEKSRVVSQNLGDRNFHVFYQVFSNGLCSIQQLKALGLTKKPSDYRFLNQGGAVADNQIDDYENGRATKTALEQLNFSYTEIGWILDCVAACILIGELRFGERQGLDMSFVEDFDVLENVARLAGLNSYKLMEALTQPSIRIGESVIKKNQSLKKTLCSSSALAKVIYERMFGWIVSKCNSAIKQQSRDGNCTLSSVANQFIGVLDMAGFEIMGRNSFEQFCINFTNEKLQQFFNQFMFIKEKAAYLSEGIHWNEEDYGNNLQNTIDMIERPMGFLSMLEEECIVPNGSDSSLLEKLVHNLSTANGGVFAKAKLSTRNTTVNHFTVSHYAGQVAYNIDGWLEKNRDLVDQSLLDVLAASEHGLVPHLFPPVAAAPESMVRSRRGSLSTSTVSCIYKDQLSKLLLTLNSTTAQFIRCIVPNYARQPLVLDGPLVLHQLRCNGVMEGIRICRQGYPNRLAFEEFFKRYSLLARPFLGPSSALSASLMEQLCTSLHLQPDTYKVGRTKVFCKVGLVSQLEARRKGYIHKALTGLQAWARWHVQQRLFAAKQLEWQQTLLLQDAVRQHLQLAGWQWWKLWRRVRQLIPLVMDKRKLKQLEADNNELQKTNKLVKSQLETVEESYKVTNHRLQQLEEEREEEYQRVLELRQELKRNEDLLELMEKKFDEQHAKIMRLNGTLKDNSKVLENLEEEKHSMQIQLDTILKRLQKEQEACKAAEESLALTAKEHHQMHAKLDSVYADYKLLDDRLQQSEELVAEGKEKLQAQEKANSTFQHSIVNLNDTVNKCETALHDERAARRRCEHALDQQDEEVVRLKEELDKANAKREAMKEQLRVKETTARKVERKLEDKTAEMDDCITELKKIHKASQLQLQTQLEESRRKLIKLELENKQQKCKLESSSLERESSVDSDFGRTNSLSRYGSRQSIGGGGSSLVSGSVRTLGSRRRETEPELLGLRSYDPFASSTTLGGLARSPSNNSTGTRLSRNPTLSQMTTSLTSTFDSGLARSSSSSSSNQMVQLQASERRASQLERELQAVKTDGQLVKREVEVYKAALQEAERAKDTLTKQMKGLSSEVERLNKCLDTSDQKLQHSEFDNRKWINECETWKQRLETSIADSKNELIAEKKKHAEKLGEQKHEYELKIHHLSNSHKSHEQLQERLTEAEVHLDKALGQLAQMERMNKSNAAIGETWESQYRSSLQEVESLRDENAALKSKIRRQYKQIELLTQQNEMEDYVSNLETKLDKLQDRFGWEKAAAARSSEEQELDSGDTTTEFIFKLPSTT